MIGEIDREEQARHGEAPAYGSAAAQVLHYARRQQKCSGVLFSCNNAYQVQKKTTRAPDSGVPGYFATKDNIAS